MDTPNNFAEATEQPNGKRLTSERCLFNFVFGIVWMLCCGVRTLIGFSHHNVFAGILWSVFTFIQAKINVPLNWKQYQYVRNGGEVYVAQNRLTQLPTLVSAVTVTVLSILVLLASLATVAVLVSGHLPLTVWLVVVPINGLLWLYVYYCWYRIEQTRRKNPQKTVPASQEGVWPPAPQRPK